MNKILNYTMLMISSSLIVLAYAIELSREFSFIMAMVGIILAAIVIILIIEDNLRM